MALGLSAVVVGVAGQCALHAVPGVLDRVLGIAPGELRLALGLLPAVLQVVLGLVPGLAVVALGAEVPTGGSTPPISSLDSLPW